MIRGQVNFTMTVLSEMVNKDAKVNQMIAYFSVFQTVLVLLERDDREAGLGAGRFRRTTFRLRLCRPRRVWPDFPVGRRPLWRAWALKVDYRREYRLVPCL
jgi:hypothetical protein